MATIDKSQLVKIRKLYKDGNSVRSIAKKLDVSLDAAFYFFRKYKIPRRGAQENNKIVFQKKAASFHLKQKLTHTEELLKVAGIMLYWGEGSQWAGEGIVDFANSNSEMVKIFLSFLRKICGIKEEKLRAYIYCYADQDSDMLVAFWAKILHIAKKQFTKPYVRRDYKLEKAGKMKYGLIHIRYGDKKLLIQIRSWIREYALLLQGWVPKRSNGADCQLLAACSSNRT